MPYAVGRHVLLAISFGVLAEPVMGPVAPIVMSAFLFAGLGAVRGHGGARRRAAARVAAILAGVLLNARYGPMGVALAPSLQRRRLAAVR